MGGVRGSRRADSPETKKQRLGLVRWRTGVSRRLGLERALIPDRGAASKRRASEADGRSESGRGYGKDARDASRSPSPDDGRETF
ncbi:MAG: hypothetical protein AMXMBFR7_23960 [Planctomycetota bacterium]